MSVEVYVQEDQASVEVTDVTSEVQGEYKEDWIDIADITTTEEAKKFLFTTDINGNSFECKKVCGVIALPTSTSAKGMYFGGTRADSIAFCNLDRDGLYMTCEVIKGKCNRYTAAVRVGGAHWLGYDGDGELIRYTGANGEYFTDFQIETYAEGFMFPVGTQIKIWGLKA